MPVIALYLTSLIQVFIWCNGVSCAAMSNVMNPCNGRRIRTVTGCVNTVNTVSAFGSKLAEALNRNNS